jgi:hypothetical protein
MSEAVAGQNEPAYYDTLPPDAISEELAPIIDELGLRDNCRQLAMEGWTVIRKPASDEFNARFRAKIKESGGGNMLLLNDPVFVEAVMNPSLLAMAEFSVGRGFLLSQVAGSIRPKGTEGIGLHADNNWVPAPFPAHNMLLTGCWATDGYTKEGGATLVIPGSGNLRRHPNEKEVEQKAGAIAIECEPGSVAMWDGNTWHANWPRTTEGDRIVSHITYTRLMMRPVENYGAHADELIEQYGERMSQLLGRADLLDSPAGADYSKLRQTFNNAKR